MKVNNMSSIDAKIRYHNEHLNGNLETPKCPVCQAAELKFNGFSKGYSKTCSYACRNKSDNFKQKYKETCKSKYGVDYASQSKIFREQVKETLKSKYGVENPMHCDKIKQVLKENNLIKYGYENAAASPNIKEKITATKEKNGSIIPRSKRTEKVNYYRDVMNISKQSYHHYFYKINPENLPRGRDKFHLDHIFSISDGFKNKISPEIIGHWTNLRLVWFSENTRKNYRSGKTIQQLYEDFNNSK